MQKFSTWMVLALDVMFWIFRIIAAYTSSMGIEFMVKPMDMNMEIAMVEEKKDKVVEIDT